MKKWIAIVITISFVLSPISAIAGSGKKRYRSHKAKAYQKVNKKAKFLRGEDNVMEKGKYKGKSKDASFQDGKKVKVKKARHDKASKQKMQKAKDGTGKEYKSKGSAAGKMSKNVEQVTSKSTSQTSDE